MIGTTVQKGFDKWGGGPASILVADNSTSLNATTLLNTSALMNGTGGVPTTAGNVEEAMSPEELSVRLGYAMSLTFMVGIIQVVKILFTCCILPRPTGHLLFIAFMSYLQSR